MGTSLRELLLDPARLAALRRLDLLDTRPEPAFDHLTALASTIFHVPVSLVVLLDADRQFFKSCRGLPEPWCARRETPLSHSFCQHILLLRQPLVIDDARTHPTFINHPAIADLGVIAYLGTPLLSVEGQAIGSFCVIDSQPRHWAPEDVQGVTQIGALVMYEIEARLERQARERAEQALQQAQKLESLGRMAASIAHDFNNILTAITGYAELAEYAVGPEHPAQRDLDAIRTETIRASQLIRQLLTFGRQQAAHLWPLDLNELVRNLTTLVRPLLPGTITYHLELAPDLGQVRADVSQLEQLVLNLVVNARDAMPAGGTLTIATADVVLAERLVSPHGMVEPGRYVALAVIDTGTGMPPEVQERALEPFFSTKELGQGTGLGLAICYAVVQQHGGTLVLESAPGQGTRITIYLPEIAATGGYALR